MRVIVAGSRSITDHKIVEDAIREFQKTHQITEVISGHAAGVDKVGEYIVKTQMQCKLTIMPALWELYGRSAGYKRNEEMAKVADALIAIWDQKSKGTKHMIDLMRKNNKPIKLIHCMEHIDCDPATGLVKKVWHTVERTLDI